MEEVRGSNPLSSTLSSTQPDKAWRGPPRRVGWRSSPCPRTQTCLMSGSLGWQVTLSLYERFECLFERRSYRPDPDRNGASSCGRQRNIAAAAAKIKIAVGKVAGGYRSDRPGVVPAYAASMGTCRHRPSACPMDAILDEALRVQVLPVFDGYRLGSCPHNVPA